MGGPLPSLSLFLSLCHGEKKFATWTRRLFEEYSRPVFRLPSRKDYLVSLSLPLWETFREESRYYARNFLLLLLLHNFSL